MKYLAIGIFALVVSLSADTVLAGSVTLKSDQALCENAPTLDKAALIRAERHGALVTLDVTVELNCAYVPDKPELRVWRNAATVILPTKSPSGAAAACLCQHKLAFEIKDLYEGAKTIYYVQDGTVLGHVDAP